MEYDFATTLDETIQALKHIQRQTTGLVENLANIQEEHLKAHSAVNLTQNDGKIRGFRNGNVQIDETIENATNAVAHGEINQYEPLVQFKNDLSVINKLATELFKEFLNGKYDKMEISDSQTQEVKACLVKWASENTQRTQAQTKGHCR